MRNDKKEEDTYPAHMGSWQASQHRKELCVLQKACSSVSCRTAPECGQVLCLAAVHGVMGWEHPLLTGVGALCDGCPHAALPLMSLEILSGPLHPS